VYVTAIGASGRKELFAYDLANRVRRAVYANPRYDAGRLWNGPVDGALWAVEVEGEKPELHFFDRAAQNEQAAIDKALPGTTNRPVSYAHDAKLAIIVASSDTNPPDYYRLDREHKRMDFLFTAYPAIERDRLAPMKPVRYTARDRVPIEGYLTVPRGEGKNLP